MIVDDMYTSHTPELKKDIHWAESVPTLLPYTEETVHTRKEEPMGGAEKNVSKDWFQPWHTIHKFIII